MKKKEEKKLKTYLYKKKMKDVLKKKIDPVASDIKHNVKSYASPGRRPARPHARTSPGAPSAHDLIARRGQVSSTRRRRCKSARELAPQSFPIISAPLRKHRSKPRENKYLPPRFRKCNCHFDAEVGAPPPRRRDDGFDTNNNTILFN